jgi:hypothetical protein
VATGVFHGWWLEGNIPHCVALQASGDPAEDTTTTLPGWDSPNSGLFFGSTYRLAVAADVWTPGGPAAIPVVAEGYDVG